MQIPEFPDSREILLEDKPLFDDILAKKLPELSAYTFTNIYAWRIPYNSGLSRIDDNLIVHHELEGRKLLLEPLCPHDPRETIEAAFERAGNSSIEFERIQADLAGLLANDPRYTVKPDRNDFDYVYRSKDLIYLHGRNFDAKRNFINRAKAVLTYDYVKMTPEIAAKCEDFADIWCEQKSCETQEGLRREQCAVYQMLVNFEALGIRGGAIIANNAVVAFCLGEELNPDTLVVHVEKADPRIDGLYQLVNNEFCIHEAAGYKYVNREQDLGVPGLRKAKESYHPVKMIEAYRVRRH